jgi:hypothetical protein
MTLRGISRIVPFGMISCRSAVPWRGSERGTLIVSAACKEYISSGNLHHESTHLVMIFQDGRMHAKYFL